MTCLIANGLKLLLRATSLGRVAVFYGPNGNIYVNPADYSENYALESKFMQGIFIHELTHVMQYQKAFMYYLKVLYYNQPIT